MSFTWCAAGLMRRCSGWRGWWRGVSRGFSGLGLRRRRVLRGGRVEAAVAAAPELPSSLPRAGELRVGELRVDAVGRRQWYGEVEFELSPLHHRLLAVMAVIRSGWSAGTSCSRRSGGAHRRPVQTR